MKSDFRTIRRLVSYMRELGMTHLKHGDLEITLGPAPQPKAPVLELTPEEKASVEAFKKESRPLTDEEMLFWSAK
jgi:hypothetical protein